MGSPTLRSTMAKYIPEGKIGEFFGAIALIDGIKSITATPLFLEIYSKSIGSYPSLVFWISLILIMDNFLLIPSLQSHPEMKQDENENITTDQIESSVEKYCLLKNSYLLR